jgi:hypothetical protein
MPRAAAGDVAVPLADRDEGFYMVVSDLVSLIDRVQASIKLLETAKALEANGDPEWTDIFVLDDVTPLYAQAGAALAVCNASLGGALQFLIESKGVAPGA